MTWILLHLEHLPMFETRKESHAMRHHNTVFHGILKQVPWHVLDRLATRYQPDKHVRRLSTRNQFVAMLYAQLADAQSLRTIEASFGILAWRVGDQNFSTQRTQRS